MKLSVCFSSVFRYNGMTTALCAALRAYLFDTPAICRLVVYMVGKREDASPPFSCVLGCGGKRRRRYAYFVGATLAVARNSDFAMRAAARAAPTNVYRTCAFIGRGVEDAAPYEMVRWDCVGAGLCPACRLTEAHYCKPRGRGRVPPLRSFTAHAALTVRGDVGIAPYKR